MLVNVINGLVKDGLKADLEKSGVKFQTSYLEKTALWSQNH